MNVEVERLMVKTRDAKPGELREIKVLETLEKLSKRPDSRLDVQRVLERLSPSAQIYIKHLVTSGPSSLKAAAKACEFTVDQVEAALTEIEQAVHTIRR